MILRTVRAKAVELDSTMVKLVAAVKVEFVFWMVKAGLDMPTCSSVLPLIIEYSDASMTSAAIRFVLTES